MDRAGAGVGVDAVVAQSERPRTSGESGTMVMITSASATASATDVGPRPPASTSLCTGAGLRLTPITMCPACTRCPAMGPPMMPRPMNAMVAHEVSPSSCARSGGSPSRGSQSRLSWVGRGWLVLQSDMTE